MKRIVRALGLIAAFAAILAACSKEFLDPATYRVEPTFAIPLVKGSMTVGDIIGAKKSDLIEVYEFKSGGDSIFSLKLVYVDTLDPIALPKFENPGGGYLNPQSFPLPERNVYLRMLGKSETGSFYFTDPSIEFVFDNEIEMGFDLSLDSIYTLEKKTLEKNHFELVDASIPIDAGTSAGSTISTYLIQNNNTIPTNALTQVFEPTPKYLYYSPTITSQGTSATLDANDRINMYTRVHLPLEGLGQIIFQDTLPYKFNLKEFDEAIEFATMRMNFINELPLEAVVEGKIFKVDTISVEPLSTVFSYIDDLPLYDFGSSTPQASKVVVPAAAQISFTSVPSTTPDSLMTEISLYAENPKTKVNEIKQLSDGNAIILTLTFRTTDYTSSSTTTDAVKLFNNQTLDVQIGIRAKPSLGGDDLQNLLNGEDDGGK